MLKRIQDAVLSLLANGNKLRTNHLVTVVADDDVGAKELWDAAMADTGIAVAIASPKISTITSGIATIDMAVDVVEDPEIYKANGGTKTAIEIASIIADTLDHAQPLEEFVPILLRSIEPMTGETQGQRAFEIKLQTQTPL